MPIQTGDGTMYSKIISTFILISLVLSFSATAAEDAATPQVAGKPADVQYPFIAKATGNDIYVRSGKGTAYYYCGKINRDDKVTVTEEVFGWARVVPPAGSYSWIHKDYVDIKGGTPAMGELNDDNVRVWAGSDYIEAMRSSSMQTKLNKGRKVELLADQPETGDYYKIKPPAGAYLWVSSDFLKYVGPVQAPKPAVAAPKPLVTDQSPLPPSKETEAPTFTNIDPKITESSAPIDTTAEKEPAEAPAGMQPGKEDSETVKQCHALGAKIDLEIKKPLNEQNYADVRKALETMQTTTTEEKAATYAQILLDRIKRCELRISVEKALKEQDEALAKTKEQIEKAYQAKLEKLPKESGFIYSGVLKVSHVYTEKSGQKRYLVQGSGGKILCYVVAASQETAGQLESLIGTKVGIQGTVVGNQKSAVTLVSATAVESLP
ncbi:MAG: SH3 domain-containing protein [Planctomycetota bacterium]|jgi:uncharacterized protein YgiM (DUF1202 family)